MPRTLLLCFIHGFKVSSQQQQQAIDAPAQQAANKYKFHKGNEDTFHDFPDDLKRSVTKQLPDHRVESIVYPQYETKGELAQATEAFLAWLKERVMDVRKASVEKPWPPKDREVGVVLVAHSMGGFVAADSLFLAINERAQSNPSEDDPIFPLIQGILTFDTPYNGLARSMFVYGGFSNYQKVSSVFNVMTALSAAAPSTLARLGTRRAATSAVTTTATRNPGWKTWQLVAVRTGTVGAIAAGGVAAYVNREAIMKSLKGLNKNSVKEGYQQSVDALGQGLAYINRGNVGQSFAWLSDHFTFVGALMKQKELNRRLERMGALKGVGIHDFYASLGENGYWQGGYFVPERTFCAVPEESHPASSLFSRQVLPEVDDEVAAHMAMFQPAKHKGYEKMTEQAADLVIEWFKSEEPVVDDAKFRETPPEEVAEDAEVEETLEKAISNTEAPEAKSDEKLDEKIDEKEASKSTDDEMPDESPIDIAAAASLVPLPADGEGDLVGDINPENMTNEEKRTYMQHLFRIAQSTGTGVKGWLPGMPSMPGMPGMPAMPNMPNMPKVPTSVSSLGQASLPSVNIFRKSTPSQAPADGEKLEAEKATDAAGNVAKTQGDVAKPETAVADNKKEDQETASDTVGNETAQAAAATGQLESQPAEPAADDGKKKGWSLPSVNIFRKSTPSQAPAADTKEDAKVESDKESEAVVIDDGKVEGQSAPEAEAAGSEVAQAAAATGQLETAEGGDDAKKTTV
ncbi:hypothetical protein HER10_EVM0003182 [Colletotrichum scovillei]|uniref:DUF676 domain-containing protein n=1 Tax=Colletotrichum scovillei TaxID=1209932 RepID=A0A9P7UGC3_9PEZI|nr:uncharacterized protein HER10_EVM0003182 [Colletotrichum scovillei]KAF4776053.1 hypothetical protein HER10_EVM0003182 [Colletotrichum scovillei]KAG7047635.1 hypothetical protein JMJ77_0010982 [Colletotrichum scovillei]KAG7059980.1 hypothetical protein JMJ78_0015264 [Colletotrichum scovillei]KAG7067400.1 hypothetical protein JMJ76_0008838 [Colletotrichum scovillei]